NDTLDRSSSRLHGPARESCSVIGQIKSNTNEPALPGWGSGLVGRRHIYLLAGLSASLGPGSSSSFAGSSVTDASGPASAAWETSVSATGSTSVASASTSEAVGSAVLSSDSAAPSLTEVSVSTELSVSTGPEASDGAEIVVADGPAATAAAVGDSSFAS